MRAYKFALDPPASQRSALHSHVGGATFAFNWAVHRVKQALDAGQEISWSHISLRNEWNAVKDTVAVNSETGAAWWSENSKWVYDSAISDAAIALRTWKKSKNGQRKGAKMGFVRFKSKRNQNRSCRFMARIRLDGHRRVVLPRIGPVRTHETTKKLARKLAQGGVIKSATLSVTPAGRWFISILVDCADRIRLRGTGAGVGAVGIDLGLKTLAVVADPAGNGLHVEPNNRHLKAAQSRLRRAQRTASRCGWQERAAPFESREAGGCKSCACASAGGESAD